MPKLVIYGRALAALGLAVHALFVPVSIAATQIGLGIALAGVLLAALGGAKVSRTPLDLALVIFISAAVASNLLTREGPGTFANATLWRHSAGFWISWQVLSLQLDARARARQFLALAAAGLIAASAVGLVQYRTGFDVVHALHLRQAARLVGAPGVPGRFAPMGFFVSRLTFGHNATILVALFAGAICFAGLSRRLRAWLLIGCGLGLVAILLTFDRAAWLGLLAASAVLVAAMIWARRNSKRSSTSRSGLQLGLASGALALLCAGAAMIPAVRSRFASGFDLDKNSDRVFLWSRALEIIRDHPMVGIGFGNYPRVCSRYYDRVDPAFPMRTWAHNSILSLWAETGILGLAALAFLAYRIARALLARLHAQGMLTAGALAAVAALIVVAQAHDVIYDSKVMYPLWFALALGLHPALDRAATSAA